uniref:Short-chain dehydrogenase/reductase SDR n=1 Tax=Panagrellus redivivus TaxID=6233 RepID=A0A7E4VSS8_PANRE
MSRFTDKVVIVTGSSAGIGKAAILGFAKEGASVVLHGTNTERLAETEKALHDAGIPESRILKVQGYLNEDATHDKIINETIARFGKIDVLVNNAGLYKMPGTAKSATENFDHVFAVNVRAVFRLVELATPHLEKTRGNIVNVSSVTSFAKFMEGQLELTVYSMTKAAIDRFTKNISQSLAKKGIRINAINPGPFETNVIKRSSADEKSDKAVKTSDAMFNIFERLTPAGRMGHPYELIPVVLLLADEKSSFITGATWAGMRRGHVPGDPRGDSPGSP